MSLISAPSPKTAMATITRDTKDSVMRPTAMLIREAGREKAVLKMPAILVFGLWSAHDPLCRIIIKECDKIVNGSLSKASLYK